jgi:hypothetical protein
MDIEEMRVRESALCLFYLTILVKCGEPGGGAMPPSLFIAWETHRAQMTDYADSDREAENFC